MLALDTRGRRTLSTKIGMDIPTAKAVKPNLRALVVFILTPPYVARPGESHPRVNARLEEVWVYEHTTGRVFAREKIDGSQERKAAVARMAEAKAHLGAGRVDDALKALNGVLTVEPMNAEAHLLLGRAYQHRGDPVRAIASFKTALFWDSALIEAHILLGQIFLERGDRWQAAKHARAAVQLDPANREAAALYEKVR